MSREKVEELWARIKPDIESLGGLFFNQSASGSIYVKFKNNAVGSLRIADHRIVNRLQFGWNLKTDDFPPNDPGYRQRIKKFSSFGDYVGTPLSFSCLTEFNHTESSLMIQAIRGRITYMGLDCNTIMGHSLGGRHEGHNNRLIELGLVVATGAQDPWREPAYPWIANHLAG